MCKLVQLCLTLWGTMDYSLPGYSINGIFQAIVLEWVTISSSSRGSFWPRNQTWVSCVSCVAGGFFTTWTIREAYTQYGNVKIAYCALECLKPIWAAEIWEIEFSSLSQSCPTLQPHELKHARPRHQLPEFTQTHVRWVSDAIQPSHPLSSPSPPALNISQFQGLFKWVSSSYQVTKRLEFQLQHQSFQWTPRTDLL